MLRFLLRILLFLLGRGRPGGAVAPWWQEYQERLRLGRLQRRAQSAAYWGVPEKEIPLFAEEAAKIQVPRHLADWQDRWEYEKEQRRLLRQRLREKRRSFDRKAFGEELWGVRAPQRQAACDPARLVPLGLPVLRNERELADWLGIPLSRLRWFTHDRPAETVWHYVRHVVPRRAGGERVLLAPKRQLKALQRKVLHELLARLPLHEAAHGFRRGRSPATNAAAHVGRRCVVNLDLQDFFPSITFPRVRGLFVSLGYPFSVASALALLCTERDRQAFEHEGTCYYVSVGPRCLVQGAPTSPTLANLVARRLDRRLAGLARKHGFTYTRYADDLTFSGDDQGTALRILDAAQRIVGDEHFAVNRTKTRLFRQSSRQVVTGLVVNTTVGVPRRLRRQLRAILHNAQRTGLEAQNRAGRQDFAGYVRGLVGYVHAANARQASRLREALRSL